MSARVDISDRLVLAAVDRAERHRQVPVPGVPRWTVLEHLGVGKRTKEARETAGCLDDLTEEGLLERRKVRGIFIWDLTESGRVQLLRANGAKELPESPQHRRWREQHESAPAQFERGRTAFRVALGEARLLFDADPVPSSDAWLLAGVRLSAASRLLAAATHCWYEWREPDDSCADVEADEAISGSLGASEGELSAIRALRSERRTLPPRE